MSKKIVSCLVLISLLVPCNGQMSFNGSTAYVDTGIKIQNLTSTTGTVSWWIKPLSVTGIQIMWGQQTATTSVPEFSCQRYSDLNIYCGFNTGGDDDRVVISGTGIYVLNQWTHFALTWVSGGNTVLYKNGVSVGTKVGGTTPQSPGLNLELGRQNLATVPQYGNVIIDDFRIYNRALASNEILSLATSRERLLVTDGLVFWEKLNDGRDGATAAGASVKDSSSTGTTGTANGSPTWQASEILNYP